MRVTPVRGTPPDAITWTGTLLIPPVSPVPNWPNLLFPHAQAPPIDVTASVKFCPPAIATTSLRLLAWIGTLLFEVVPLPSCPTVLDPQVQTYPGVTVWVEAVLRPGVNMTDRKATTTVKRWIKLVTGP